MNTRISAVISASLTLLAVAVAATAKGYVDSLSAFTFVVCVTAVGVVIARFWAHLLTRRMVGSVDRAALTTEAVNASVGLVPAAVLVIAAAVGWLASGSLEVAVTAAMIALTVLLFAYTWVGTRALLWSLGTAMVATLMTLFKVVA